MVAMHEFGREVASYYSSKLAEHGETPQGVDWNGKESQTLRFAQLAQVFGSDTQYSLNDLGCGYGALLDYLWQRTQAVDYCGIDVSQDMISAARARHKETRKSRFIIADRPDRLADYGLASGIFNVRQERTDEEWSRYVVEVLGILDQTSRKGFAFNCLTAYSDYEKMRSYLYYADPIWLLEYCKSHYSNDVVLLHEYGLFEFTILVRKPPL